MSGPLQYKWFFESTTPVEGHMHAIARTIATRQTKFQFMEIMETHSYGKVLVLDGRIQDAKADVIKLNRDLLVLEEELLFPANTQVALFVSMDVGKMFQLDSVQVKLDDKVVANYLYTALEVEALHRGGVQRVYLGNLKNGKHELVAFFTGKGPHERDYKRGANVKFEKTGEAKYIELRIQDSAGKLQPEFDVKLWQ